MVGIVTGTGAGLERSSGWVLGSRGQLGDASFGRYGEKVWVNAASGNLVISRTDEILTGLGPDNIVARTYNSLGSNAYNHLGSADWQLNASRRVASFTGTKGSSGTVTIVDWDGSEMVYTWSTDRYVCKDGGGAYDTVSYASGVWTRTDGNTQVRDVFDDSAGGRITATIDTDGNQLTYAYDTNNKLASIETENGEKTEFTWTGSKLDKVETRASNDDLMATRVTYSYDSYDRLWKVTTDLSPENSSTTDGKKFVTTYTYDGTTERILSINQDGGGKLDITYDDDFRVETLTQTFADGGGTRETTFDYLTSTSTKITDEFGQSTTLIFNSNGELKEIDLPEAQSGTAGQVFKYNYDSATGDVLTSRDGFNIKTLYRYDARGNLETVCDPLGNTTTYTYSDKNELLIERHYLVPDGDKDPDDDTQVPQTPVITRYAYDSESHLRFVVSAEGRVTEYQYGSSGLHTVTIRYPEDTYNVGPLGVDDAISEGDLVTWAAPIDETTTAYSTKSYDSRGNIDKTTDYSGRDSSGAGLSPYTRVLYSFDYFGNMLTRQTPNLNEESFEYDGLARVVLSVDINAAETNITYVDSNSGSTVELTLASGLHKLSTYNRAGALISYAEFGSGIPTATTTYKYDDLGQLRMVTDPTNRKSYHLYDAVGRKVADVGADGSLVEYGYDANNRLVKAITYSTVISGTQLGLLDDLETYGSVTDTLLSEIRPSQTQAQADLNTWEWRIYDKSDRLIEVIDGTGGCTGFVYDGASRLTLTKTYFNVLGATTVAGFKTTTPTAYQTPTLNSNEDTVTRNFYDDDGQLIGTLNAVGAFTQHKYEGAGRKSETIAYATLTNSSHWVSGDFETLLGDAGTSASDIHNYYIYDGRDVLKYWLDTTRRPTEYFYNGKNQLTQTIQYAGSIAAASEYTLGYVSTQITSLNLAAATGTGDSWNVYDAAARLAFSVDQTGAVVAYSYDSDTGALTDQVRYATLRTSGSNPTFSNMTSWVAGQASNARNEASVIIHETDGSAAFGINAAGFVTAYAYDTAGRVIRAFTYETPITPASSYPLADVKTWAASITAGNTRKSWSAHDVNGRVAFTVDSTGAVTGYGYNTAGQVIKRVEYATLHSITSDPTVNIESWAAGEATTAGNRITRKFYDEAGRLAYDVDAEGFVTKYGYDPSDRATLEIRYADSYTVADTDTRTTLGTLIGSPSTYVQKSFSYDASGRLTDSYDGEGVRTKFEYDALDRVTRKTIAYDTADAAVVDYEYHNAGWLKNEKRASGLAEESITRYEYDVFGRVTDRTDAHGTSAATTTHYAYDLDGRIVSEIRAYGQSEASTTAYAYDPFGNVITTTDPLSNISYLFYDKLNRLTLQIDQEGFATTTTYTVGGAIASVTRHVTKVTGTITAGIAPTVTTNSADATTTFEHDKLDRVTKVKDAEGYFERYSLDAFGNRTEIYKKWSSHLATDTGTYQTSDGGKVINTYDRRGLLLSEKFDTMASYRASDTSTPQATSVTNKYEYDSRGNRTKMTEAFGLDEQRVTTYTYDKMDRLKKTVHESVTYINADLSTGGTASPEEKIDYDRRGNIIQTTDAMGSRTIMYYDDLNRKTWEVNAFGTLSQWLYVDNVTKVRVYGDKVTLPTNPTDACPSPVNANNCRETVYTYDRLARLATTTVANVLTGEYSGSAYSATSATGSITITNVYDAFGNIRQQTDGRGNSVFFYYDKRGIKKAQVDQEKFITTYDLDANGNVVTEKRFANQYGGTVTTGTQPSVSADTTNDRVTNFTYDRNGQRLTESRTGVKYYSVNTSTGAPGSELSGTATVSYQYNGLGEVTKKTEATTSYTDYAYDVYGRQTAVTSSAFTDYRGTSVQHAVNQFYDGLNNLTRTFEADQDTSVAVDRTTLFTYDKMGRLATMTDASGFVRTYAYDKNGRTILESYQRLKSDGNTVDEGNASNYDVLGRVILQGAATKSGSTWSISGDKSQTKYNVYGEVEARGVNIVNDVWQENFFYDSGGRMWKSTAGDGTTRLYIYDKNGAQTLAISSSGAAPSGYSWSTVTIGDAVSLLTTGGSTFAAPTVAGMALTVTVYDKRGQSASTREPARQLDASTTTTIVKSRAYNAFGEIKQETDARGYVSDYTYSTLGKVIKRESPTVSWTSEAGADANARPTEEYFYDLSGRVVGVKDANGKVNTRTLLAGTGHGDDNEPSVLKEFHADGGQYERKFDVYGDLRSEINEVGKTETFAYDKMGRLVTQVHEQRTGGTQLTDTYTYDGLGHRITHYNSQLGSSYKDLILYDAQGRVLSMTNMGGDATTYTYTWDGGITTDLNGTSSDWTFGGWTKTTTNAANKTLTEKFDYFGRLVDKTDFGNHNYDFTFDRAGRTMTSVVNSTTTTYGYYNTGLAASIVTGSVTSSYKYDAAGNRTFEGYQSGSTWLEYANVAYDAMNRMTSLDQTGAAASTGTPTITWKYDLKGNIRNMHAVYNQIDDNGNVITGTDVTQDYWYKYDSMNRFVLTKGQLISGVIQISTTGLSITYNAAGQRATVTKPSYETTWQDEPSTPEEEYTTVESEVYTYSADGYLEKVETAYAYTGYAPQGDHTDLTATYTRDAMGRVTDYKEFTANSQTNAVFRRQTTFNAKSQVTQDITTTVRDSGGTWTATTSYDYLAESSTGSNVYTGAYMGGLVTHTATYTTFPGDHTNSEMRTYYEWWDSALTKHQDYDAQSHTGGAYPYESEYTYDTRGNLTHVEIDDGRPRDLDFVNDAQGRVLTRHEDEEAREIGDPFEIHYYFNGMRIGDVSNNGTSNIDYAASIAEHTMTQGSGPFRNGTTNTQNVHHADFDQSYDPINGLNYGSTASHYTVVEGDTLIGIAQAVWGDSSYWYLIADANGLDGGETLIAGTDLIIPNKVHNIHNSSDVYRVYDPNEAIGNSSPTSPKPPKKADKGCGVMGQVLLVVIAVVVAYFTAGAALSAMGVLGAGGATTTTALMAAATPFQAIAASAIGGAAGSIASQTVGVVTGIQSKFDWGGVAMAAIGAGVGAGLGTITGLSGSIGADMLRGALGNAITQGIGVATGLQKRFDWAGVAAAGVMAGVTSAVAGALGDSKAVNAGMDKAAAATSIGIVSGMAGMIAGAATRSLINGSDFGDNILAMLPDFLGQTFGNMIAEGLDSSPGAMNAPEPGKDGGKVGNIDGGMKAPVAREDGEKIGNISGGEKDRNDWTLATWDGRRPITNDGVYHPGVDPAYVILTGGPGDAVLANRRAADPGRATLAEEAGKIMGELAIEDDGYYLEYDPEEVLPTPGRPTGRNGRHFLADPAEGKFNPVWGEIPGRRDPAPYADGRFSNDGGEGWRLDRNGNRPHGGIDVIALPGTPVVAAADGIAGFGWSKEYGNILIVQHFDGHTSFYAHLDRIDIQQYEYVRGGQLIAASGVTGSTVDPAAPHLHFEVWEGGLEILPQGGIYMPPKGQRQQYRVDPETWLRTPGN